MAPGKSRIPCVACILPSEFHWTVLRYHIWWLRLALPLKIEQNWDLRKVPLASVGLQVIPAPSFCSLNPPTR